MGPSGTADGGEGSSRVGHQVVTTGTKKNQGYRAHHLVQSEVLSFWLRSHREVADQRRMSGRRCETLSEDTFPPRRRSAPKGNSPACHVRLPLGPIGTSVSVPEVTVAPARLCPVRKWNSIYSFLSTPQFTPLSSSPHILYSTPHILHWFPYLALHYLFVASPTVTCFNS